MRVQPVTRQVFIRIIGAVDALRAVEVVVTELGAVAEAVLEIQGIEGLFVLAPADIAEEALVVPLHTLPAEGELGFGARRISARKPG